MSSQNKRTSKAPRIALDSTTTATLSTTFQDVRDAIANAIERIRNLDSSSIKHEGEVERLDTQLTIAHDKNMQLEAMNCRLESDISAMRDQWDQEADRVRSLKTEKSDLEKSMSSLRKKFDSQTEQQKRFAPMADENSDLKARVARLSERAVLSAIKAGADIDQFFQAFLEQRAFLYPQEDYIDLHRENADICDYLIEPSPFSQDRPAWRFRVIRPGWRTHERIWQAAELQQVAPIESMTGKGDNQ